MKYHYDIEYIAEMEYEQSDETDFEFFKKKHELPIVVHSTTRSYLSALKEKEKTGIHILEWEPELTELLVKLIKITNYKMPSEMTEIEIAVCCHVNSILRFNDSEMLNPPIHVLYDLISDAETDEIDFENYSTTPLTDEQIKKILCERMIE